MRSSITRTICANCLSVINVLFALLQVSIQRLWARVLVRQDLPRILRGARVFVVARQVLDTLVAATGSVRATQRQRRPAASLASSGLEEWASSTSSRQPRPPRARLHRHGWRSLTTQSQQRSQRKAATTPVRAPATLTCKYDSHFN